MMFRSVNNFIFALFVFWCSSLAYADHVFEDDLDAGKGVVLIINMEVDQKSELYADWAHYLNEFSSSAGERYAFHKLKTVDLKKIINNPEKYTDKYSMMFIKKGKPSFFYKGAIVEPQVYKYVDLVFQDKPIKPKYLKQFAPEKIKLEFKGCK